MVVTARRRAESLQKVPIAVTTFTPVQLESKHIVDATSLATFSPSMTSETVNSNADAPSFAIRGQATTQFGAPGTVVYFAEVPESFFGLSAIEGRPGTYFDLGNVQVLNGPQGTLFGKNATGGSILFVPNRPMADFGGYLQLEGGNYNDVRGQGAVNIPLVSDKALLRIAGEVDRRDGYVTDVGPYFPGKDYNNVDDEAVRVSLLLNPTSKLENYSIFRYYREDTHGPGYLLAAFNPDSAAGQLSFLFPGLAQYPAVAAANGPYHTSYNLDQRNQYTYWQIINSTSYKLTDDLTLKNIVSYAEDRESLTYSLDGTPYSLFQISNPAGGHYNAPEIFTEEFQLQGKALAEALNYSVGAYYDHQNNSDPTFASILVPLNFLFAGDEQKPLATNGYFKTNSHAAFAQGTYDVGKQISFLEGLSLTAGYRYTWESVTSFYHLDQVPGQGPAVNTNAFNYGSYTVGADYRITPSILAYVSARSATKSGGSNLYQPNGSPYLNFKPEKLEDVEIGVKSQFKVASVPALVNIAAYTGDYSNVQRTVNVVYEDVPAFITLNTAQARIRGVEFLGNLYPTRDLTLSLSYAYIDSAYLSATQINGVNLSLGAFPYTPKNKVSLSGTYDYPMGDAGKLSLNVVYTHQSSESVVDTVPSFIQSIQAQELVNLRVTWANIMSRPVDLSFFMTNVADKSFVTAVNDGYYKPYGTVSYLYNEPRMFGAQLRYHF